MKKKSNTKTSMITTWKPTKDQIRLECEDDLLICHLDKIFKNPKFKVYNVFLNKKTSYVNQLDVICRYVNFFMEFYDTDDVLINAYMDLKFMIDKDKVFTKDNMDAMKDAIYEYMITPYIVKRVIEMVDDNYLADIEKNTEEEINKKTGKRYLESLEFTNQHVKILLAISFCIKMISPIFFHYLTVNEIKLEKNSLVLFNLYKDLFTIFGHTEEINCYMASSERLVTPQARIKNSLTRDELEYLIKEKASLIEDQLNGETVYYRMDRENCYYKNTDDPDIFYLYETKYEIVEEDVSREVIEMGLQSGDLVDESTDFEEIYRNVNDDTIYQHGKIDMFNKLYVYIKTRVLDSYSANSIIFSQHEIFGVDMYNVISRFTKVVVISENMVKYLFNEVWDEKKGRYKENIPGFNKTIVKYQLTYYLKEQYDKNLTEINNTKTDDGLSSYDVVEMNMEKKDRGSVILTDINIETTMKYIRNLFPYKVSDEELDFYMENFTPTKLQKDLVHNYYARFFGGVNQMEALSKRLQLELFLIMKKRLLDEASASDDPTVAVTQVALPYLLTAKVKDRVNNRIIRNEDYMRRTRSSDIYKRVSDKLSMILAIKPDFLDEILSKFINTNFTYITYENPELLGKDIVYNENKIVFEILSFIDRIVTSETI